MDVFIGVDIGGSHVSVGYLDDQGRIISEKIKYIDGLTLQPDQLIESITTLIDDCNKEKNLNLSYNIRSVGIGCPGQCKNGSIVSASNFPLLHNFPIVSILREVYSSPIPIVLLNDADAAISAEVWGYLSCDVYKGYRNIAMITLGTGIGCGLILQSQLYQGSNGLVEAGHMIVDSSLSTARKCGCGQYGCAEVYSSAKNMAIRMYEEDKRQNDCKTRNDVSGADRIRDDDHDDDSDSDNHEEVIMTGIDLSAQHVFERYLHSDPLAVKIMEETADYLSVLAINICRVVDPEIIIFSGGLAKAGDIFLDLVRDKMKHRTWTVLPTDVQLVIARSIDNGGMVGAALAAKKLV